MLLQWNLLFCHVYELTVEYQCQKGQNRAADPFSETLPLAFFCAKIEDTHTAESTYKTRVC